MSKCERTNNITTLSLYSKKTKKKKPYSKSDSSNINNKMKGKRVGKKDANTDNTETCYQRGN